MLCMWAEGYFLCLEEEMHKCVDHHKICTVMPDLAQSFCLCWTISFDLWIYIIHWLCSFLIQKCCILFCVFCASMCVGFDFIIQVLNTVGWWVFGLVMGRTPEWRYLMGQKATLSRLWDSLVLAVAIDFSSKLAPCFLIGLWWNPCQASQMCLFAWAQSNVNFQFCSDGFYVCQWMNYETSPWAQTRKRPPTPPMWEQNP